MPDNTPSFTTYARQLGRTGELAWGGSNGWSGEVSQTDNVSVKNGSVSPAPPAPTDGLVAHWTFDSSDVSGSTVLDATGNGYDGKFRGDASAGVPGVDGEAAVLNGSGDEITVPHNPALVSTTFTIAGWVRPDTVDENHYLVTKEAGNTAYHISLENSNEYRFHIERSAGSDIANIRIGDFSSQVGEWIHLAGTYDGAQAVLYVDGAEKQSTSASGTPDTTSNPLHIGSNRGVGRYATGRIDDVRYYNHALSADAVHRLYTATK